MEFYKIEYLDGRFVFREDDGQEGVELTQENIGLLLDRLGAMYHAGNLPLTLRKYVMMYYSNESKEYVSLAEAPSLVVCHDRLKRKFDDKTEIEGVALTFLDGDEENRVMLSIDGDVETRGVNILETWQMLDILVDGLNDAEITEDILWQSTDVPLIAELKNKVDFYQKSCVDENMEEITWYWQKNNGKWVSCDWQQNVAEAPFKVDLPIKEGRLCLSLANGEVVLSHLRYPWQKTIAENDYLEIVRRLGLK